MDNNIVNQLFALKSQKELEKINEQIQENNELVNDIENIKKNSIYTYITDIDNYDLLLYIFIFITFVSLLVYSFEFNMTFIFSFILGIVLVYFLNEQSRTNNQSDIKQLELKLNAIYPKPQYFHYDSRFIDFVHNNKEYQQYNPDVYEKMIKQMDNFLKLKNDIQHNVKPCSSNYQVARDLMYDILNNYESLYVNLPVYDNEEYYEQFRRMKDELQLLLLNHLNQMQFICNTSFNRNIHRNDNYVEFNKPLPSTL